MKRFMADRTTCQARRVRAGPWSWENWYMAAGVRSLCLTLTAISLLALGLSSCHSAASAAPGTLNFLIESMPTNLDPRVGTDAFSAHIDGMIF